MRTKLVCLIIFLAFLILLGGGIAIRASHEPSPATSEVFHLEVRYIPGWNSQGESQQKQIDLLKKTFPDSGGIAVSEWRSRGEFDECVREAERYARTLAAEILQMPPARQRALVLVGHSLGGRIAIRTMAILRKKGVLIQRGIFMGAAIPDNDPDIALAIKASIYPNINIYNRNDFTLRHGYGVFGEHLANSLGAYGYDAVSEPCCLQEYPMSTELGERSAGRSSSYAEGVLNHNSEIYLDFLSKIYMPYLGDPAGDHRKLLSITEKDITATSAEIKAIEIIQDRPNGSPVKIVDALHGWETLENFCYWRLQRNGGKYRIIDPRDFQRANGCRETMETSFENIKRQWRSRNRK